LRSTSAGKLPFAASGSNGWFGPVPVPHDLLAAILEPFGGMLIGEHLDLVLKRRGEHPARALPNNLGRRFVHWAGLA
jgi:hypothetical protein